MAFCLLFGFASGGWVTLMAPGMMSLATDVSEIGLVYARFPRFRELDSTNLDLLPSRVRAGLGYVRLIPPPSPPPHP